MLTRSLGRPGMQVPLTVEIIFTVPMGPMAGLPDMELLARSPGVVGHAGGRTRTAPPPMPVVLSRASVPQVLYYVAHTRVASPVAFVRLTHLRTSHMLPGLLSVLEARSQCTGLASHCWPPWPSVQSLHDLGLQWSAISFRTGIVARQGLQEPAGRAVYTSLLTTTHRNGQRTCGNQTSPP